MMASTHPRPNPEAWRDQALCKTRPDLNWFPGRGENQREQKAICQSCPVRAQCLDEALVLGNSFSDHGIWGGLSERARRAMRAGHTGRTS